MSQALPRTTLLGVLFMIGAAFFGTVLDTSIKFLSSGYALHEIILIRTIVAIAMLIALALRQDGDFRQFRTTRPLAHLLRMFIVLISNVTFFTGLAVMPLADALAIAFVAPMFITAASGLFLKEPVGPHRWGAVIAGMIGVVIMLRPGSGVVQPAALLILLSSLCYATSQLMSRQMRASESSVTLNIYLHLGFLISSLAMGLIVGDGRYLGEPDGLFAFLLRPWVWPAAADWPVLFLVGISVALHGLMVSQAYRLAEAALIAPFEYLAMPIAIVAGVTIFGDWPDRVAWSGMTVICGAGLYILWREMRHRVVKDPALPVGDI